MYEVIFLWVLALAYIIFAVVQDFKTREIANWITFSLAIFAIVFRFFYSLFGDSGFSFFFQGLIGFAIFFALGNLFYYSRVFAGGDAKLMIALGAILPISEIFSINFFNFVTFLLIFLFSGFAYILIASIVLCIRNFKSFRKEFLSQIKRNKTIFLLCNTIGIAFLIIGIFWFTFLTLGILTLLLFYLYLFSKSIDEVCMIKNIQSNHLREGDWLYSDVHIGKNVIKASWDGLTKQEISQIKKKYEKTKIRQGIPFSPNFLIAFAIFIALKIFNINLWDSFW
jgi:Flp pilus assembly protein protease CpaA